MSRIPTVYITDYDNQYSDAEPYWESYYYFGTNDTSTNPGWTCPANHSKNVPSKVCSPNTDVKSIKVEITENSRLSESTPKLIGFDAARKLESKDSILVLETETTMSEKREQPGDFERNEFEKSLPNYQPHSRFDLSDYDLRDFEGDADRLSELEERLGLGGLGVPVKQVVVGICAMKKKSSSKPMKEILSRLEEFEYIRTSVFQEEVILDEPVENWPLCDCLVSFHSKGFPLEKAKAYANLRKPYIINNLDMQYELQDRRAVYRILQKEGIQHARFAVLDRDSPDPAKRELIEGEDHVEVNGIVFNKPFVEKPISAEDHNIYIYYPTSAGGGSQRLFRKIGSRSSVYSPESRVRKTGSFIYEDFMPTDGTDVKVYTVGPDYAHAEARKSPALDGKVERDSEGKEVRYPVILSSAEKLIARKVCIAFKQMVCGFDLLRANGKSYVCDVNGFSFVKNSSKYYDDCAKILGNMILRELAPTFHIPWAIPFQLDDPPIVPTTFGKMMELRCVVAVIRHGDRTPKQKMKMEVRHPKFFELFAKYDGYKDGHIKLKKPKQLQEILDIARGLLSEIEQERAEPEIEEKKTKLEQLKCVLEISTQKSFITSCPMPVLCLHNEYRA